tara:strand:+ start:5375 stop:8692 length:3318 start_codon:yes stop_codon:yes gene_type:complete
MDKAVEYFNGDELAANVFLTKYAMRNERGEIIEETPDAMHERMAAEFARVESKFKNSISKERIFSYLRNFKRIVPQGSPMAGIGHKHVTLSLSNCVVVNSPEDNISSIMDGGKELANLFKRRCGVGLDISNLRPEGAYVNNSAGTTTGAWSFADFYSYVCRMIGQNGRRGALMITMDVRHPDILQFIRMKNDLQKVTGANVSVRLTDDFMKAVKNEDWFELRWPIAGEAKETKTEQAQTIWQAIITSACKTAEPGILMWDNILRRLPANEYEDFKTICTNPCVVGETLIAVADGRNAVSIIDLMREGKPVPVYSVNTETGQTQIKMARNFRVTGYKKEIYRLTLNDGSFVLATPDHEILTKTGFKMLKDLEIGESLVPFNSFNSNGYRQISSVGSKMTGGRFRNRRQYRVIHEFYNGITDAKKYAIHHRDFNGLNDNIDNLEVMLHEQHRVLHAEKMMGKNNPYHSMNDEWKLKFASHPGETNGRYSGFTNEELIEFGKQLLQEKGKFTKKMWQKRAKKYGWPQTLNNNFRFGSFSNFKSLVVNNHKVQGVDFYGYEDVYDCTVEDNHNYNIITNYDDNNCVTSSGITLHNCGEIPLSAYDSCRLISINLKHFVKYAFTNKAFFDFDGFAETVATAMRMSDDLVELELEHLGKIIESCDTQDEKEMWGKLHKAAQQGRRTGLGTHGLADVLARLRMKYGEIISLSLIDEIYSVLKTSAYTTSVDLAEERGPFPAFNWETEKNNEYIQELPTKLIQRMARVGRRNISILTNAPTGSVSILSQTSSGLEPVFRNSYTRRRKLSHNDVGVEADFVDPMGDRWQNFEVYHHNLREFLDNYPNYSIPEYFVESDKIPWEQRILVQAAIQKHIDHSISSTINLPKDTTPEDVGKIYMEGWKKGLKGVTVYVDGSRTGVLITEDTEKKMFEQHQAPKRSEVLNCEIHRTTIKGEDWVVLVGMLEDKPYEVFAGLSDKIELPKKYDHGTLKKRARKTTRSLYDLTIKNGGDPLIIKDVVEMFDNPNNSALTRLISLSLRHGAKMQYVVEQILSDYKNTDFQSFSKVVARVLKKYIDEGTSPEGDKHCEQCQSDGLIYVEGCQTCQNCGFAKCG